LTLGVLTDFEKYLFTFDFRNSEFNFLKIFFYWPSEGLKSLKSICWLPVSLIDKRKVICDHSHLVNIIVYFGRIFVYFLGEIFVVNFDRGLNLTYKIFFWHSKWLETLKSICRPPVRLIDKRS
jgi:hypothetical protein